MLRACHNYLLQDARRSVSNAVERNSVNWIVSHVWSNVLVPMSGSSFDLKNHMMSVGLDLARMEYL